MISFLDTSPYITGYVKAQLAALAVFCLSVDELLNTLKASDVGCHIGMILLALYIMLTT
jgi:hypothetical protein